MKRSVEALVVLPMQPVIAVMAIVGLCGIARAEPVARCDDAPRVAAMC